MKMFEAIVDRRVKALIENTFNDAQSGFSKGRSIQGYIPVETDNSEGGAGEKKNMPSFYWFGESLQ